MYHLGNIELAPYCKTRACTNKWYFLGCLSFSNFLDYEEHTHHQTNTTAAHGHYLRFSQIIVKSNVVSQISREKTKLKVHRVRQNQIPPKLHDVLISDKTYTCSMFMLSMRLLQGSQKMYLYHLLYLEIVAKCCFHQH